MSRLRQTWGKIGVPLAIGTVFAAPLALALALYGRPSWQPEGSTEHGELLRPVRAAETTALTDLAGSPLPDPLRGHWTLLYRNAGECAAQCLGLMDRVRRISRAQADGRDRLQRLLVVESLPPAAVQSLAASDPKLRIALSPGDWSLPAGWLYLIDPLGNLVLRYRPDFDAEGLGADLKRLMRLSRIG